MRCRATRSLVYLMNHRSNADYVLVSYALAGRVAISYAVGEWARAFPLEHIFKAFGSYFVRRRYREPLYHAVLERYVQLITREGVTQGIFLEGGLTRDGRLQSPEDRPARLRARHRARPGVPRANAHHPGRGQLRSRARGSVAASRAAHRAKDARARHALSQLGEVTRYLWWNAARLVVAPVEAIWTRGRRGRRTDRRWTIGSSGIRRCSSCREPERLARVQALCDGVMSRIGAAHSRDVRSARVRRDPEL